MDQTVLTCAATIVEIQTNVTEQQGSVKMDVRQDGRNPCVKNVSIGGIYVTFQFCIHDFFLIQDTYKLKIHHIVQLNCLLKQGVMLVYLVKIARRSAGNALWEMLVTM